MGAKHLILAVDDEVSLCEFYEKTLPFLGYDVAVSLSAKEAREAIRVRKPSLILMDIMMPGEDGIGFTRELRASNEYSDIPIIVVSGLADAASLNDALLFGAVDYIVKPIEIEILKSKIERALAAVQNRKKNK